MSERGSVLSFVIQVAVVQCEFISSEEHTEGTQHLKWEFITFKNSNIQVFTTNTSGFHSLWYLPFSRLCTFCLIVWVSECLSVFCDCLLLFLHFQLSSLWRFFLLFPSSMTEHLHYNVSFHFIIPCINDIQIFLVCLLVCLWVQYPVCAEAHSRGEEHSLSPLPAPLKCWTHSLMHHFSSFLHGIEQG